mgnify:FL=1
MSIFNSFDVRFLCKTEKTLFAYVFSRFSIDKSAKSDYNIIAASAKRAKLNQTKGADTVAKQRKPKKRQKKSGNREDTTIKTILLITAILQLARAILELLAKLTG